MKKVDDNVLRLLILLIIAVVVVCAFRFGYVPFNDKTELVEEEIVNLEAEAAQLNIKIALNETYKTGIDEAKSTIEEITSHYSAGNTPEKSIMMIRGMEARTGTTVNSVSFGAETQFFTTAADPAVLDGIYGFQSSLGINYETDYKGLKSLLLYISEYPERMNLGSLTATFNAETGNLSGNASINLYSLIGTGKEYIPPVVSGPSIGTENIFGTFD